jgi:hypothetical protein
MTREEIESMVPGRKLDAFVAKYVMFPRHSHPIEEVQGWCDHYSTQISAAWQVVEKFPFWKITLVKNRVDNRVYIEKEDGSGYFAKELPIPEAICKAALLAVLEATP